MRTEIAKQILAIARRVLENIAAGRIYDFKTEQWAKEIVAANGDRVSQKEPA